MDVKEMRVERRKLWEQAKAILDKAETEKRALTAEEDAQYKRLEGEIDALKEKIDKAEAAIERQKKMGAIGAEFEQRQETPLEPDGASGPKDYRSRPEYEKAFRSYLIQGEHLETAERRALQGDSDIAGGYVVAPQQFVAKLLEAARNMTFVRQRATVFQTLKAESLGAPALDNRPADPTWTAEILVGSEDSTMTFGKRELYPHPLAQYIKVSKKLIRSSVLDMEGVVRDQLAYKAAITEENAFLNGDGSNEPLGVFTADDQGISTSRDVSTGNTDSSIQTDGLIEAKYTLLSNYWGKAVWVFHRDAVKQIRKLKDGEGQYIWRPGVSNDRGDSILDIPVIMSEYPPHTFTTGLYVGILGDFSYYWIADALDMQIQTLVELYAATNQNGYILRKETDGLPVLEEAFVRVKLA
jgi:HK97 family phage major capsid protein